MSVSFVGLWVVLMAFLGGGGNHLLDLASTEAYWKSKGVAVSLDAMLEEIKAGKGAGKAADVRRLMAIRTLGELKKPEALAALQGLLDSKEMFVAEYAARAIAGIEGKPFEVKLVLADLRKSDVWLLPAACAVVIQQAAVGAHTMTLEMLVNSLDLPDDVEQMLNRGQMLEKLTDQVIGIAEQMGDVRVDSVTVGVSGDVGDNAGFVAVVLRGEYDSKAAAAALRAMRFAAKNAEGVDVFQPEKELNLICPSDDRFILITGPNAEALPVEATAKALKAGKGTLPTAPDMANLINSVDTRQPLWGVVKVTEAYRELPMLAAFDTITLVGRQKEDLLDIQIVGKGTDATQVSLAVEAVNGGIQAALLQIKPAAAQLKFLSPVVHFLEGIKCTAEGDRALLTATAKANSGLVMLFPMFIGVRAQNEVQPPPQMQLQE